jgi:hypothetical protein
VSGGVYLSEELIWKFAILYVVVSAAGAFVTGFFRAAGREVGKEVKYRIQANRVARELRERYARIRAMLASWRSP